MASVLQIALLAYELRPEGHLVTGIAGRRNPTAPSQDVSSGGRSVWKTLLLHDHPKVTHALTVMRRFPELNDEPYELFYQWVSDRDDSVI